MKCNTTVEAKEKLASYSVMQKRKRSRLRSLILESARELDIDQLDETLKWVEISYLTKK